jgi:hypothetical protein
MTGKNFNVLLVRQKGIFILFICLFSAQFLHGQQTFIKKLLSDTYNPDYITSYTADYTTRFFCSIKNNQMGYHDNMVGKSLIYRPNNSVLLGIGANHGILGLNLGFNLPFINRDDDKYGKTNYYDLTMRVFSRKFNVTIYLQDYKGFYLRNTRDMIPGWDVDSGYYIRRDIKSYTGGIDISYIFNYKKFSCRAAVVQTEWQRKSAGSFMIGGTVFYNTASGDSSIVPSNLYYGLFFNDLKFHRSTNFSMGPTFGYAYTFVYKEHFFLLGSLNASLDLAYTQLHLVNSEDRVKSGTVYGIRTEILVSTGYNSEKWYFGISLVDMNLSTQAPIDERTINFETGFFRINFVRRFATRKPIKVLNPGLGG